MTGYDSDCKKQILTKQFGIGGIGKFNCFLRITKKRGKTTISNAGISKRVFRKPPGAPGRVRVAPGPPAGLG